MWMVTCLPPAMKYQTVLIEEEPGVYRPEKVIEEVPNITL